MKLSNAECYVRGHVAVSSSINQVGSAMLTATCARCGRDIYHERAEWHLVQARQALSA